MKKIRIYWISFQFILVISIFAFAFFTACSKENLVESATSAQGDNEEPSQEISATSGGAYGQQMVPPVSTPARAHLSGTYEHGPNKWGFGIEWQGLSSNPSVIEIRGPAEWGQNGALVFSITAEGGTSAGISHLATLSEVQEADLLANKYYYVIKTSSFPNGEIRGQIIRNAR
jgi:hypothetical protein